MSLSRWLCFFLSFESGFSSINAFLTWVSSNAHSHTIPTRRLICHSNSKTGKQKAKKNSNRKAKNDTLVISCRSPNSNSKTAKRHLLPTGLLLSWFWCAGCWLPLLGWAWGVFVFALPSLLWLCAVKKANQTLLKIPHCLSQPSMCEELLHTALARWNAVQISFPCLGDFSFFLRWVEW